MRWEGMGDNRAPSKIIDEDSGWVREFPLTPGKETQKNSNGMSTE